MARIAAYHSPSGTTRHPWLVIDMASGVSAGRLREFLTKYRGATSTQSYNVILIDPTSSETRSRSASRPAKSGFGFEVSEIELRNLANEAGLSFDDILDRASKHFTDDRFGPRTTPLTDPELDALVDDDDGVFGDRLS